MIFDKYKISFNNLNKLLLLLLFYQ